MHDAAYQWVAKIAEARSVQQDGRLAVAVELGAYNVNGSVRDLFPSVTQWTGVDVRPGPGVDVVLPAEEYRADVPVDLVVCTEVLEHTPNWREIVQNAYFMLRPRGVFIVTAASTGRTPHGCNGGDVGSEYYANIAADDLTAALMDAGFDCVSYDANESAGDVYAVAFVPGGAV